MSPRTRKDIPNPKRCTWAEGDPLMEKYHDEEWGFPVRTTRKHFEQLTLEIFQAGLSWRTILHKRAEFRKEFLRFSPEKVALFTEKDIRRILGNPGVVRNRKKNRGDHRERQKIPGHPEKTWLIQPLSRIPAGRSTIVTKDIPRGIHLHGSQDRRSLSRKRGEDTRTPRSTLLAE